MTGLVMSALCYRPMFSSLLEAGNPQLVAATRSAPVTVHADTTSEACKFGLAAELLSSHGDHGKPCVQAKKLLIGSGINFSYGAPVDGQAVSMTVNGRTIPGYDAVAYRKALSEAGYPAKADPAKVSSAHIVFLLVVMTVIVAMIYGPVASFLVEMFPANIRYTALSFPYHIGAGIFGGFLPFFATYLSLAVGDVLERLRAARTTALALGAATLLERGSLAELESQGGWYHGPAGSGTLWIAVQGTTERITVTP